MLDLHSGHRAGEGWRRGEGHILGRSAGGSGTQSS